MQAVYILDIKDIEKNYERILKVLPLSATQKAAEYKDNSDKLRFLGGALLIETFTSKSPLLYHKYGKPYKETPPFFNISHSGDKVGIFLDDDGEVGFDIQRIKDYNATLTARVFPEKELAVTTALNFAKFWTMKEGAAKLTGEGIVNPERQVLTGIGDDAFVFGGKKVYYKTFIKGEYAVTACAYNTINVKIYEITFNDLING